VNVENESRRRTDESLIEKVLNQVVVSEKSFISKYATAVLICLTDKVTNPYFGSSSLLSSSLLLQDIRSNFWRPRSSSMAWVALMSAPVPISIVAI
jgi:hypothetical protein